MDCGDAAETLTRRANDQTLDLLVEVVPKGFHRLEGIESPQVVGRYDAHLIVADDDLDRRIADPGDNEAIVAGFLELSAPLCADVRTGEPVVGIGLGTKAADRRTAGVG